MKRLLILALLLAPLSLWAGVFNMASSGNIDDGTKYTGGVAPNLSGTDTITCSAGVTVTMNVNFEGGDPAAPTTATIASSCGLTVNAGVTFVTKANVDQCNGNVVFAAGSTLWFKNDTALAWNAGNGNCTGTLTFGSDGGARVTVKGTNTAGTANTTRHTGFKNSNTSYPSAVLTAYNVDWSDVGAAGSGGYVWHSTKGRANALHTVKGNTFTRTGELLFYQPVASEGWDVENNSFYETVETNSRAVEWYVATAPSGSPTRKFIGNYIRNGQPRITASPGYANIGMTFTDNVIVGKNAKAPMDVASTLKPTMNMTRTLVMAQSSTGADPRFDIPNGTHQSLISLVDAHAYSGTNDLVNIGTNGAINTTIDGAVFESWKAGGSGAAVPWSMQSAGTAVLKHALMPTPTNQAWKSAFVAVKADLTGFSATIEHNTLSGLKADGSGILIATETASTSAAAVFPSVQSNLVYAATTNASGAICGDRSSVTADGLYTTCNYNGYYNLTTANKYPLASGKYTNTPGGNDLSADPQHVDPTRNFLNWCKSVDASLTDWATCVARFDPNAVGYSAAYNITDAYNWVRAGWAPKNAAYRTAAHDGATIGAVDYQAPATPSGNALWFGAPY